jgi:hypothetical protein
MPVNSTINVRATGTDGADMTFAELAAFVEQAHKAGVDGNARLRIRSRATWKAGPLLRTIETVDPA